MVETGSKNDLETTKYTFPHFPEPSVSLVIWAIVGSSAVTASIFFGQYAFLFCLALVALATFFTVIVLRKRNPARFFIEITTKGLNFLHPYSIFSARETNKNDVVFVAWKDIDTAFLTSKPFPVENMGAIRFTESYRSLIYQELPGGNKPEADQPDLLLNNIKRNHIEVIDTINRFKATYGETREQFNLQSTPTPVSAKIARRAEFYRKYFSRGCWGLPWHMIPVQTPPKLSRLWNPGTGDIF